MMLIQPPLRGAEIETILIVGFVVQQTCKAGSRFKLQGRRVTSADFCPAIHYARDYRSPPLGLPKRHFLARISGRLANWPCYVSDAGTRADSSVWPSAIHALTQRG